ncbi:hypothetical protein [Pasteurella multocida]|uniref:hypothetical protein n=1 Tax=Pasteurella multocida TaxID=747 RepID=UPI002E21AE26
MPGSFTQIDKSSGTVSVNVRGGTGFGRVNTMIDGVSQTFMQALLIVGAAIVAPLNLVV